MCVKCGSVATTCNDLCFGRYEEIDKSKHPFHTKALIDLLNVQQQLDDIARNKKSGDAREKLSYDGIHLECGHAVEACGEAAISELMKGMEGLSQLQKLKFLQTSMMELLNYQE